MNSQPSGNRKLRLAIGLIIAVVSLVSYFGRSSTNEVTGEVQQVSMTPREEVQLGLAAVPSLTQQYGGAADSALSAYVESIGNRVVARSVARDSKYQFKFVVLNDTRTINAFALPGGPVFVTRALLSRLGDEAQLAGVLGHEIGHVLARHGAQKLAKAELTQGLVTATGVATEDRRQAQLAAAAAQLVVMKYGREDELESDALGVRLMAEAGYDAAAMVDVLEVLKASAGGARQPEFFSTHPNPENRIGEIQIAIAKAGKGGERNVEAFERAVRSRGGDTAPPPAPAVDDAPRAKGPTLPAEALQTLSLIDEGGPFPYPRDGVEFQNREGLLPRKPAGYYREYTVKTPGERTRGARRIVTGANGERYYTDDHYESFTRVK